ncbi:hypothetical protein [Xanthomonas albilineans]|uniref:hypothetical protein n=1 Tax=Xanthomonas albilineans TaxID=29447 RepID=UPI0005F33DA7|nr:hypothetical protein [Xanthomonas albilineans]
MSEDGNIINLSKYRAANAVPGGARRLAAGNAAARKLVRTLIDALGFDLPVHVHDHPGVTTLGCMDAMDAGIVAAGFSHAAAMFKLDGPKRGPVWCADSVYWIPDTTRGQYLEIRLNRLKLALAGYVMFGGEQEFTITGLDPDDYEIRLTKVGDDEAA